MTLWAGLLRRAASGHGAQSREEEQGGAPLHVCSPPSPGAPGWCGGISLQPLRSLGSCFDFLVLPSPCAHFSALKPLDLNTELESFCLFFKALFIMNHFIY